MNRRSFLRTLGLGSAALAITGCVIPEKPEWDRRPWEPKWDDALVQWRREVSLAHQWPTFTTSSPHATVSLGIEQGRG